MLFAPVSPWRRAALGQHEPTGESYMHVPMKGDRGFSPSSRGIAAYSPERMAWVFLTPVVIWLRDAAKALVALALLFTLAPCCRRGYGAAPRLGSRGHEIPGQGHAGANGDDVAR